MKHTHTVAHNKFSDWLEYEMNALLVLTQNEDAKDVRNWTQRHKHDSWNPSEYDQWSNHHGVQPPEDPDIPKLPSSVDWVKIGKVSPI